MLPGYCISMAVIVLWIRLGLCVTGLLIFRQPQWPMVVPLVYDEECLHSGLPETYGIMLFFVLQLCFRYSYVFFVFEFITACSFVLSDSLSESVHGEWS